MLEQVDEDDSKRELIKYNFWDGGEKMSKKLEDDDPSEPFDQFKGKQSDYNWEIYSTKLPPESSMTREQIARATKLEQELTHGETVDPDAKEEILYSAVSRQPHVDKRENL